MGQSKENLKLLLEFIANLLEQEGNEWFHDELANLISKKIISEKDAEISLAAVQFRELGSINKYIENGLIPLIDFSDILDTDIKFTLERDCIEMGKCRFSHFGKNQSFYEFCKFAFFQIEQLVNYYIVKKNNNSFSEAVEYIKKYNDQAKTEYKKTVSSIAFSNKLYAIKNQTGMNKELKGILDKVSYARNNSLHRSSELDSSSRTLYSDFNKAIKRKKEERDQKEKEIIKDYYFYRFIEERNYNDVTTSIVELKRIVVENLN